MLFEKKTNGMFSLKESTENEEIFIPLHVIREACKQTQYEVEVEPKPGVDTKTITKQIKCGGIDEDEEFQPELELDQPAGLTHNIEQITGLIEDLIDGLHEEDDTDQLYDLKNRLALLAGLASTTAKQEPESHFDRDAYNSKHREVMERRRELKGQVRGLPLQGGKLKC
jgi:hypothetical protein